MELDPSFQHSYAAEVLGKFAEPVGRSYLFTEAGDRAGLPVVVKDATGDLWTGYFGSSQMAPTPAAGLWSCPNPDEMCVVSGGLGIVVNTRDPSQHFRLPLRPVVSVLPISSLRILVFADFTRLAALGPGGIFWRSDRLSYDGIRALCFGDSGTLIGEGWNAPSQCWTPIEVDTVTGRVLSGAFP